MVQVPAGQLLVHHQATPPLTQGLPRNQALPWQPLPPRRRGRCLLLGCWLQLLRLLRLPDWQLPAPAAVQAALLPPAAPAKPRCRRLTGRGCTWHMLRRLGRVLHMQSPASGLQQACQQQAGSSLAA